MDIASLPAGNRSFSNRMNGLRWTCSNANSKVDAIQPMQESHQMKYVAPELSCRSFTCAHCGVLARQQKWGFLLSRPAQNLYPEAHVGDAELQLSLCDNCGENSIWVKGEYIYPAKNSAPRPNPDLPANILADYNEAAAIHEQSPRGAAALLRLAVQKLMVHLGQSGQNINDDIAVLVANGLPKQVQQALDVVRITGNNAVHPGKLDADDVQVAKQLFPLVNLIVEYQISMPARVQELYDALPVGALNGIDRRDKKA